MDETRVVLVKPGDILVFGNIGPLTDGDELRRVTDALRSVLSMERVVIFEADIDMAAVPRD